MITKLAAHKTTTVIPAPKFAEKVGCFVITIYKAQDKGPRHGSSCLE